jgi:hypothetical protein
MIYCLNSQDCPSGVYCNKRGSCFDDVSGGTDYRCECQSGWKAKDCDVIGMCEYFQNLRL